MKILLNHTTPLHLEPNFEINIEKMNPLLSEQGSSSLPLSLPPTKENIANLGYPDRLDRLYKISKKTPVLIQAGIMRKQAILEVMSYKATEGIESVLLLDEAEMYTKMQEISLPSIFTTVRKAQDLKLEGTFETPLDKMIKYMELVYLGQIQDDFRLFTVATDYRSESGTYGRDERKYQQEAYNCLNLQKRRASDRHDRTMLDTDLNGNTYYIFHGRTDNDVISGSQTYDVPKGYGITPFLKESYVIREIFNYFGYQLEQSILDTDPDLSLLVLINNTADAIVKAQINYAQLVPTCTIHEYLQTVRQRFGCEFYVTEDHKRVVPIFWKDILKTKVKKSCTAKVSGKPAVEFITPKQLKLCYCRNIEFADMAADTIEKFEKAYQKVFASFEKVPWKSSLADGFYYIQSDRTIQELYTFYDQETKTYKQNWRFVARNMFDYYLETTDVEYEEPSSNIEYLPEMMIYGDAHKKGTTPGGGAPFIHYRIVWALFIGERRHMNTTLKVITTDEKGNIETKEKQETTASCPIMVAYARVGKSPYSVENEIFTYGTMFCYDLDGKKVGNTDLTFGGENGLYKHFWQERDRMLQHSNHKVTVDIHLNEADIMNFRMDELIDVDGQVMLPEKLQYSLRKDKMDTNQAEFRTVRLYKDPQ